jgi:hypothetical protein
MKQSKSKKQPTRDDLAATWKIIRDQSQIIRLQAERIHRQKELLASVLMKCPRLDEFRITKD